MTETDEKLKSDETVQHDDDSRAPYEPPQLLKKRSVSRVTLFSGAAATGASGLTAA